MDPDGVCSANRHYCASPAPRASLIFPQFELGCSAVGLELPSNLARACFPDIQRLFTNLVFVRSPFINVDVANPRPQLSGCVLGILCRPIFYLFFFSHILQNVRRGAAKARPSILSPLPIRTMLRLKIIPTSYGGHNACSVTYDDSR